MVYQEINANNREQVNAFILSRWYTDQMILRGAIIDMTQISGIAAYEDGRLVGLLTYTLYDDVCEIVSLDSLIEGRGLGTSLIRRVASVARNKECAKLIVITTNDNIRAIRFYQKRGFDMARLYRNALDQSRKLKPEIPLIGEEGIPLRHELEFELKL